MNTCNQVSRSPHFTTATLLLHKVAEQDLGMQRATWISKLDMSHTVDSSFFQDGESSPIVVDVRLQDSRWRFGGQIPRQVLPLSCRLAVPFLLATTEY